jgi:hypothetical protein
MSREVRASPPHSLKRSSDESLAAFALEHPEAKMFFAVTIALVSSRRKIVDISELNIALKKAISPLYNITPPAGALIPLQYSLIYGGV